MKKIKLFLSLMIAMIFCINVKAASNYLDDALGIDYKTFYLYMELSSETGKYLGTRYVPLNWDNLNFEDITDPNRGFNCAGFVYRAFADSKAGMESTMVSKFGNYNYRGAGVTDWLKFIQDNDIVTKGDNPLPQGFHSGQYSDIYAYDNIENLLASGIRRGEVIILIPTDSTTCDTHIGFYWGDFLESENTSTSFWHSSDPENHITEIVGKDNTNCDYRYVALKFKKDINVIKKDPDFNPIEGVKFGLYSDPEATNLIAEATTDEIGWITFTGVVDDVKYYIKEIETTSSYVLNTEIKEAEAGDFVDFVNQPTIVEISKVSATDSKELPGATLQILDENKKEISCNIKEKHGRTEKSEKCKWVSGSDPVSIVALPAGTYYLIETSAPKGYALNKEEIKLVVKNDGSTLKYEMKNKPEEVDVPNTLLNSKSMIIIGMIVTLIGFGIVTYVKTKMKISNKI